MPQQQREEKRLEAALKAAVMERDIQKRLAVKRIAVAVRMALQNWHLV